jgi:hypothetical protein
MTRTRAQWTTGVTLVSTGDQVEAVRDLANAASCSAKLLQRNTLVWPEAEATLAGRRVR